MRSVVIVAFLLAALPAGTAAGPPDLEDCDRRVRESPDDPGSYYCYLIAARSSGRWEEAASRLETILESKPDLHRARLNLAMVAQALGQPRAESLYRESNAGMHEQADHYGEIYGRLGLTDVLGSMGRLDEVEVELEAALEAAELTGDPYMKARVWVAQARHASRRLDSGRALRLFTETESVVFPKGPVDLQVGVLSGLGSAWWSQGNFHMALDYYRREVEFQEKIGDYFGIASARHNIALMTGRLLFHGEVSSEEYESEIETALEAAIRANHLELESKARLLLGQERVGAEAIEQFDRALEISSQRNDLGSRLFALRLIAFEKMRLGVEHHEAAHQVLETALEEARQHGRFFDVARAQIVRAALGQKFGYFPGSSEESKRMTIDSYLEALEAVEQIRDLQPEQETRAYVFSQWAFPYYRLSGWLMEQSASSNSRDEDLDLAFRTAERMRSRVLLDTLDAARASMERAPESDTIQDERSAVLLRVADVQTRLMDPALSGEERKTVLDELEDLEEQERSLRDRIARADRRFAELRAPEFPHLREVQQQLEPDQALLSYQVWHRPDEISDDDGGSWVIVVTSSQVHCFEITEKKVLDEQISIYLGLLQNRDGSERRAATLLFDGLVREALSILPESVTRLVIIPDGVLYQLPFSSLRSASGDKPLAARYEISYTPSAGLWLGWQRNRVAGTRVRQFALADPEIYIEATDSTFRQADPWVEGLLVGRLPYAKREAEYLHDALGGRGEILAGPEASEWRLKQADLADFDIIHFAAHAVVDEKRSDRSAILLVPGSPGEDGLLQIREIVDLPLDDKVVLLTTCRSASGALLEGEGVMGFARAFFQSGARAVLGSLWPLRDDEAALLMKEFSDELARGQNIASALASARRTRIRDQAPAADWAGMVVLGDGDVVPMPGGRPFFDGRWSWWGVLVITVFLFFCVRLVFRQRRA